MGVVVGVVEEAGTDIFFSFCCLGFSTREAWLPSGVSKNKKFRMRIALSPSNYELWHWRKRVELNDVKEKPPRGGPIRLSKNMTISENTTSVLLNSLVYCITNGYHRKHRSCHWLGYHS